MSLPFANESCGPLTGLDAVTLKFAKIHHSILYISCNPDALQRDLASLCKTHEVPLPSVVPVVAGCSSIDVF